MARFRLTAAHVMPGPPFPRRLRAGTIICDGTACSAGDVVWNGLNASNITNEMDPLDAAATTMKNASRYATTPVKNTWFTGADSVDP